MSSHLPLETVVTDFLSSLSQLLFMGRDWAFTVLQPSSASQEVPGYCSNFLHNYEAKLFSAMLK